MSEAQRVLVVEAHPDDAEFAAGGTLARLADAGHEVTLLVVSDGYRGTLETGDDGRWRQREDVEVDAAAEVLGMHKVLRLHHPDGFVCDVPYSALREEIMRVVRRVRPHALMTWDPWAPYEDHPDHRAVASAASDAAGFAHFPRFHPEHAKEGLEPWYVGEHLHFAKSPRDHNFTVDVAPTIDRKIAALRAHGSQMEMSVGVARLALQAAGMDLADLADPMAVVEPVVRAWAALAGEAAGFGAGEVFRRRRFPDAGPLAGAAPDLLFGNEGVAWTAPPTPSVGAGLRE